MARKAKEEPQAQPKRGRPRKAKPPKPASLTKSNATNAKRRPDDARGAIRGARQQANGGRIGQEPYERSERTARLVRQHVAAGTPQAIVARLVGISESTLRRHYPDELDLAKYEVNAAVIGKLIAGALGQAEVIEIDAEGNRKTVQKAVEPVVISQIFWAKTRCGFKETSALELSGPDGQPIETEEVPARERLANHLARIAAREEAAKAPRESDG